MTTQQPEKLKRTFRGVVVKNAMQKTIVVKVTRVRWHPKYHRQYRVSHTFKVHDEKNSAQIGDMVEFVETRPLSKEKRWRLVKKLVTSGDGRSDVPHTRVPNPKSLIP